MENERAQPMIFTDLLVDDTNGHKVKVNIKIQHDNSRYKKAYRQASKNVNKQHRSQGGFNSIFYTRGSLAQFLSKRLEITHMHQGIDKSKMCVNVRPSKSIAIANKRAQSYKKRNIHTSFRGGYKIVKNTSYRNFKKYGRCSISLERNIFTISNFVLKAYDDEVFEHIYFSNDRGETISIRDYISISIMTGLKHQVVFGEDTVHSNGDKYGNYMIYINTSSMNSIMFVEMT